MDSSSGATDRLLSRRIIVLGQAIDDAVADRVAGQLLLLAAQGDADIHLYVNSPGGSVSAGMAVHDTMRFVACDVVTVVMGMAAGIATVLAAAGAPGRRQALPGAELMLGAPTVEGGGTVGQAERLAGVQHELVAMMAGYTGQPPERIRRDAEHDRWFTAGEAVEYGLIDSIVTAPAIPSP